MTKNADFTVIVGDMVRSRDILNRQDVSSLIRKSLDRVNTDYREEIHAPLVLTRGIDELSGVLKTPAQSYNICRAINDRISPYTYRFTVVYGALDVETDSKNAGKMDGPAFHNAACKMDKAKKMNRYYLFDLGPGAEPVNPLLNELANMVYVTRSEWSDTQRRISREYQECGRQDTVASKLSITQQAVSDSLRSCHWKDVINSEKIINAFLSEYRYKEGGRYAGV